ncbi:MAG: plasmid stabilization protein [Candidatus Diapherotrites archaeon]|uniref:Plasmid stabilization protein n=1 Tax=Candidatus Iainarchaeum sp. TaxID=3101447 RepID=A0A2D6M0T3_9ARCH|nr:plasmid stabilization protein [Candidatus Diapherotrites archaeon]|tara:strand:- start:998 stop:1252 length:255 start_codon:yes stop_codon:yes gene_type:complete
MVYEIEYSSRARRELKKLDKSIAMQVLKGVEKIAEKPFLAKPLSNVFKNKRSEHTGKYRVVFSIKGNTIIIAKIEHRKKAYRKP